MNANPTTVTWWEEHGYTRTCQHEGCDARLSASEKYHYRDRCFAHMEDAFERADALRVV